MLKFPDFRVNCISMNYSNEVIPEVQCQIFRRQKTQNLMTPDIL